MANQISFGGAVTSVARFILAGNFSLLTTYQPMSVVFDPASGASYVALTTTSGNAVSNATYWSQMTASGGVASVNGRGGVVTLTSSDCTDHDTALGVPLLDSSAFLKAAQLNTTINAQTLTTYTIVAGDRGKLVTLNNSASVAVSVPQATGSFAAGWFCEVTNLGSGVATLTPVTSTIDGATSITLKQFQSITLTSVSGNWICLRPRPAIAPTAAVSHQFITAIAADGTGTLAQPSAADLSNGTTGTAGTAVVLATSPSIASPTLTGTAIVNSVKQASGLSFSIADPLGVSHFFVSSSSPYTNTFINGNGAGVVFLGSAAKTSVDDVTGQVVMSGATSGTVTLKASTVAGSGTLTFPAATDTLVGKATTDTFSGKTLVGASLGNSVSKLDFKPAAAAIVGNSADQTFFTYTLPANTLAVGAGMHYRAWFKHTTGTASVTYKVSFGGTNIGSFTSPSHGSGSYIDVEIYNNGSTSAQSCSVHYNDGDTAQLWAFSTTAINTTSNAALTFTFNVANTDQLTPEMARGFY